MAWAIINGERKVCFTLFQMGDGVYSGPIAAQAEETIHDNDTIATLYARIEERGLELLRNVLPVMAGGKLALRQQDESMQRLCLNVHPKTDKSTGLITVRRLIT